MLPGLTAAALLTACAAGPDYAPPSIDAPNAFQRAEAEIYTDAPAQTGFWEQFRDPLLEALVEEAITANHDLRIGLARYDRSRALLGEARREQLPSVTAGGSAGHQRLSASQMPGASRSQREGETYEAGLSAFWELDFFGRVRRGVQSQRADSEAHAADLDALRIVVVAELVDSYFQLRGLQEQLRVSRANAEKQGQSLALVETRLEAGRGTELDRMRARAQLGATLSRIPFLEGEIAALTHRIAVLVGRQPGELIDRLEPALPPPALPPTVAAGLPGDLLRRRPDIIAAERRLEAATARIGVATADLYPRFTLGGFLGTSAASTGDLFSRDSETRLIALGVDWSFLDSGRVRARMAAADADAEAGLAAYEQTILLAMEETETAMARYQRALQEHAHLEQAARDSADAARLAQVRYEGGVIDFLEVIDAERVRLENENGLAVSHTRSARALVALYRALAGGWPPELFQSLDVTALAR
ncbi:MAG: efflux transporter outer membrane subunit [Ectothiorhodospiraceae bacterium]|nr:efflux transporter outer membrane subunit [Ectothiorhodospiraceae bacterium]